MSLFGDEQPDSELEFRRAMQSVKDVAKTINDRVLPMMSNMLEMIDNLDERLTEIESIMLEGEK